MSKQLLMRNQPWRSSAFNRARNCSPGSSRQKNRIAGEFRETLDSHTQLFQLTLREAEALAFQTDYPHLLFPSLALEKLQTVSAWQARQQWLQREAVADAV